MRAVAVLFALGGALAVVAASSPAAAQNARSWVASTGSDGNSCTRSSPCASFARALAQTNAGGEINCIDQGDFSGPGLAIQKSITIDCEGVQARLGILFPIAVNVSTSDVVTLRGLDIDGNNAAAVGIAFTGGGALHVEKCVIRNFNATGSDIVVAGIGDSAANSELFVSDTVVTNNGMGTPGVGILAVPFIPNATAKVTLNRVEAKGNFFGIKADATQASGGVI
ncbi:MAG: hypothetical protein JO366_18170, partial [Methylobacteriaceae bacterium]|nr:hypothetical protein [Methylobacteriaceae bacterium]MBV9246728.1 hypothetical protein [Methylobacteriaceae bacterium]